MSRIALYPGSFDPVTVGHLDLIARGAALFDELVVAVLYNPAKKNVFTPEERVAMLETVCRRFPNVRVISYAGFTTDLCRREGAAFMLRGLRGTDDYISEERLSQLNHRLMPEAETVFLPAREEHRCVSSSAVREIALFGGDIAPYVPEEILDQVQEKLQKKGGNQHE